MWYLDILSLRYSCDNAYLVVVIDPLWSRVLLEKAEELAGEEEDTLEDWAELQLHSVRPPTIKDVVIVPGHHLL